jgi:hypothetical protein
MMEQIRGFVLIYFQRIMLLIAISNLLETFVLRAGEEVFKTTIIFIVGIEFRVSNPETLSIPALCVDMSFTNS